jgi:two-component system response regulator AlgR
MRILIADDEPLARQRLRALVADIGEPWQLVGEVADGLAVVERCKQGDVDLVLLDIRMPGLDGMAAAARLQQFEAPPVIIFTTAYSEQALEAFEHQALDYLLKPIRLERLHQALDKALGLSRVQKKNLAQRDPEVLGTDETETIEAITVKTGNEVVRWQLDEVLYFRAEDKYILVRHLEGEALIEDSLKHLEQVHPGFLRIHRNTLVNPLHLRGVKRLANGQFCVLFKNNEECLEISRRHLSLVRQWLADA